MRSGKGIGCERNAHSREENGGRAWRGQANDFQNRFGTRRRRLDGAECPSLPGCVSQGRTGAEAIDNIREAVQLWLETEVEKRTESLPANAKILEVTV